MTERIRTLLVDDEPDFRLLVRLELIRDGRFDVVGEAGNGAEAVTLAETQHPDLIILDLAMPVVDGLKALPMLREVAPQSKILVVSAFEDNYRVDRALEIGGDDFVLKGGDPSIAAKAGELFSADPRARR